THRMSETYSAVLGEPDNGLLVTLWFAELQPPVANVFGCVGWHSVRRRPDKVRVFQQRITEMKDAGRLRDIDRRVVDMSLPRGGNRSIFDTKLVSRHDRLFVQRHFGRIANQCGVGSPELRGAMCGVVPEVPTDCRSQDSYRHNADDHQLAGSPRVRRFLAF